MTENYAGNSNRKKEGKAIPEKKVAKVIEGQAIQRKKTIGQKIKDLFVKADFKNVAIGVFYDTLIPSAKNMAADALQRGVERTIFGESAIKRRDVGSNGYHVKYGGSPIRGGGYRGGGPSGPPSLGPGRTTPSVGRGDILLKSREDAELVVEQMNDLLSQFEMVSIGDLNDLCGIQGDFTDNSWGWTVLGTVPIRQVREGFIIDFPPAEAL